MPKNCDSNFGDKSCDDSRTLAEKSRNSKLLNSAMSGNEEDFTKHLIIRILMSFETWKSLGKRRVI